MNQKADEARSESAVATAETGKRDYKIISLDEDIPVSFYRVGPECAGCISVEHIPRYGGDVCLHQGPCNHTDRDGNTKGNVRDSSCDTCGKMVCRLKTANIRGCKDHVDMDIAARAYRDEPANERKIRGLS
jgi:hypothetical protein